MATLLLASCTGGSAEREVATTVPRATTTFATLPPVGIFTYATAPAEIIARVSVDGPLVLPLLTVYGDGRVITIDGDRWVEGRVGDLALQEFFADARSVGLLDESLVLRGPEVGERPNITATFAVDGRRFDHELDLARIERPIPLRAFLQRAATGNVFDLTEPYDPGSWIVCDGDVCRQSTAAEGSFARPLLPGEDPLELAASAGIDAP